MKPVQLAACIHAAQKNGLNAEAIAEMLCVRFGGEMVPMPDAFYRGMEEVRGVERTACEALQGERRGQ